MANIWRIILDKMIEERNEEDIQGIADLLKEADKAKAHLRQKGYGWTGLGLMKTVEQVPYK